MNELVKYLLENGHVGPDKAVKRTAVARALKVSVRDVTRMGNESRLSQKWGEVVCFSKAGKNGGLFLDRGTGDDVVAVAIRLKCEAIALWKQLRQLKATLANHPGQGKVFHDIDDIVEKAPDAEGEEAGDDRNGG